LTRLHRSGAQEHWSGNGESGFCAQYENWFGAMMRRIDDGSNACG